MCLKESFFPYFWKVSSMVPVFKNVGEKCAAKNYRPVSLISMVRKVFEKLVNDSLLIIQRNMTLILIYSKVLGLLINFRSSDICI